MKELRCYDCRFWFGRCTKTSKLNKYEVDKVLEKKILGYQSRAEFIAEAVRDKLIQIKK